MSLADAQAGDIVVLSRTWQPDICRKVARLTKTQIIVGNTRYRKVSGREVGGHEAWHASFIRLPREGEIERLREAELRRRYKRNMRRFLDQDGFGKASISMLTNFADRLEVYFAQAEEST